MTEYSPTRERAFDALALADAALAPRDPAVVEAAARWQRQEIEPMSTRNTTAADACTVRPQPAAQPQPRSAPGVSVATLEAVAAEIGGTVGKLEKRIAKLEDENLDLMRKLLSLSEMLSKVQNRDFTALERIDQHLRSTIAEGKRVFGTDEDEPPRVPRLNG